MLWLWAVPALLPVLNFSPWSGWLVFEEFDLLLLGTLAGVYARLAWQARTTLPSKPPKSHPDFTWYALLAATALSGVCSLWRGLEDAGGFQFDWFAGYTDALNSWRVFKSLGFALLFVPLLRWHGAHASKSAQTPLAWGMVSGLTLVTLAILWERAAFPGVFDFSAHYRTVALFWEMHVGGAAIDAYLAISTPFVVWALLAARRPGAWLMVALLALLTAYAGLTTFSRGVYLAMALPLSLLTLLLWFRKHEDRRPGWRARPTAALTLALVLEVVLVLEGGTFMADRLNSAQKDFSSRLEHWQHGLALLRSPTERWLGLGLGRLPANYATQVAGGEFAGVVWHRLEQPADSSSNAFVTLRGPPTRAELGGSFELTQRVQSAAPKLHRVHMDIRVEKEVQLALYLCQRHLLYDRYCHAGFTRVKPVNVMGKPIWQSINVPLRGDTLEASPWYAPRLLLFSVSVVNAGGAADIDNLTLQGQSAPSGLRNSDFSAGMAHWFPAAVSYFVPWHLDNLLLEVLVERGLLGLLVFLVLVVYALWQVLHGPGRRLALSPYWAASLVAVMLVGLVSSVLDVPRVAFLFLLLLFAAIELSRAVPER